MFREYRLSPWTPAGRELVFEWDADAGQLRGRDAAEVEQLISDATFAGEIVGDPHPTVYEINDPHHNAGEFALVLAQFWKLPPDLAAAYPKAPADETPPGAAN